MKFLTRIYLLLSSLFLFVIAFMNLENALKSPKKSRKGSKNGWVWQGMQYWGKKEYFIGVLVLYYSCFIKSVSSDFSISSRLF